MRVQVSPGVAPLLAFCHRWRGLQSSDVCSSASEFEWPFLFKVTVPQRLTFFSVIVASFLK